MAVGFGFSCSVLLCFMVSIRYYVSVSTKSSSTCMPLGLCNNFGATQLSGERITALFASIKGVLTSVHLYSN